MADEVLGGLTVDDVNKMQNEMNNIDADASDKKDDDNKSDVNTEGDANKLDTKLADANSDTDDKKDDDSKGDEKDEGTPDAVDRLREQNRILQESLNKLTADYQKLNKILLDKGVITEEEAKITKEEEEKQNAVYIERQNKLMEIVEMMELSPKYSDVRQVCSQSNLDDIISAFSRYYAKENGGSAADIALKMEQEVWSEINPYKKIYELVKTYHPKYAKKDDKKDDDKKDDENKLAKSADGKKAVDVNPSAATIGGGGGGSASVAGWTSAKIDALDEEELQTVPKDVYEKYLAGTLK